MKGRMVGQLLRMCVLSSGSSGNAIFLGTGKANLLIDNGLTCKQTVAYLKEIGIAPQQLDGILVTHEHVDHTRGIRTLARKFDLPVYANALTWDAMAKLRLSLAEENCRHFDLKHGLEVGDLKIEPFRVPHDAAAPVGFSFYHKRVKVTIATDLGHASKVVRQALCGADAVILEANHDEEMLRMGSYPWPLKRRIMGDHGHLSNKAAGETLVSTISGATRRVILAHLSKENNFPELAHLTVTGLLEAAGHKLGDALQVDVSHRDRMTPVYHLENN